MNDDYLYQVSIRKWIENSLDINVMIPVFGNKKENGYDIYLQNCLLPINEIENEMRNDSFNIFDMKPQIVINGNDEKRYERWGNNNGYEPIIIKRDFNGLAQDIIEVVEEFRLLFNLNYNEQKKEYIDFNNGNYITVVKQNENDYVYIHKKYLKTYLAVKNKALLLHIDSRCTNLNSATKIEKDEIIPFENRKEKIIYRLKIGKNGQTKYSIVYAKKIILGCKLENCNIWPYNEGKEKYLDFIVGIDENGEEIKYTCNPDKLNDSFGNTPYTPTYLTPVFFNPAVLSKYYEKPEIYKVDDGTISCGSKWVLRIDRNNPEYVTVWLGDLGNDLPDETEQRYWQSYNIAIDGKLSETQFKRDILAIVSDPEAPDLLFKQTYERVNKIYSKQIGFPLFLSLEDKDAYNFDILHIPANNSIKEMDELILSLVKVLIDSLNEKAITKQLRGNYANLTGSISKLEKWLTERNIQSCESHIKFLRNLQELRSSGSGHRKGKNYDKITKELGINNKSYAEIFSNLLNESIKFLLFMEKNLEFLL